MFLFQRQAHIQFHEVIELLYEFFDLARDDFYRRLRKLGRLLPPKSFLVQPEQWFTRSSTRLTPNSLCTRNISSSRPRLSIPSSSLSDVSRRDPKKGIADLEAVKKRIRAGESAMVFPEGVFYSDPGLRQFFMGGFVIAASTATPVIPVAIQGARAIWRGKTWLPHLRPGSVTVTVMRPIEPDRGDWQAAVALRNECRSQILPHTAEFDGTESIP